MVDQLHGDQGSLATPPKLWQAVKVDVFEMEDSQRKGFFALYIDVACKLASCSCFTGIAVSSRKARRSYHISRKTGCSIFHSFTSQFVTLEDVFSASNLEKGQAFEGLDFLTALGEFHGLTADLENIIRGTKRLARRLSKDHPLLTLVSCVSLACSCHNNGFKTGGCLPVQWTLGAGHG